MRHGFRLALLTVSAVLVAATESFAHHSVSGQFDTSKSLTLTGVVSRVDWIHPHIYLYLDLGTTTER